MNPRQFPCSYVYKYSNVSGTLSVPEYLRRNPRLHRDHQIEIFSRLLIGLPVGQNDLGVAIDDSQVIGIGHGMRKARWVADSKDATHS